MPRWILVVPRLALLLALSPLVLGPGPSVRAADPKPMPGKPATAPSAATYVRSAAAAATFLGEINRIALDRSAAAAVRQLAERAMKDQQQILAQLARQSDAVRSDVAPDAAAVARQDEMLTRLRAVAPSEFDQTFLTLQLKSLQDAVQLHESYRQAGGDAALQKLAGEIATLLQQELGEAARIAKDLGTQTRLDRRVA